MRKIKPSSLGCFTAALIIFSFGAAVQAQLSDVTQPGDPIIASSPRSPGSEVVGNVIDDQPTKYLNFDSGRDGTNAGFSPSGFVVSPRVGVTYVTGLTMTSANDAPERDPSDVTLDGSNDETITNFDTGTWTQIVRLTGYDLWTNRFQKLTFLFPNNRPYRHYRWTANATRTTPNGCCMQIAEVELLGTTLPTDVTQPGDPIFASSPRSPGSEVVGNAIDNQPTKYLNFDSGRDGTNAGFSPSGFAVSPSVGRTLVTGISMESANDAPERDPKTVTLEGSNDPTITDYNSGTWTLITTISNNTYTARFQTQTYLFDNFTPYRHYRWTVLETATTPNGCCMQIAEVELLGTAAPVDVTQPGDPIIASSPRSPGSEVVANAIDNQPTKYLNFDSGRDGTNAGFSPSGFVVTPTIGPTTVIGMTMESANDAPERDPTDVTLEGSNDDIISSFDSGNWELIAHLSNYELWTNRFQTLEFYFPNKTSYKSYRWTVIATRTTPNGCCMQIAEVELLAVPRGGNTNVIDTLIRRQPKDTPVLLGSQATFRVILTGPWLVQWYKNGIPIPGATGSSYTTPPATQPDDGALFQAVVQSPQGTQYSDTVMLNIFTPSVTESIGLSWVGSSANGAPTAMLPEDITGFQPQAYWNNLTNGSGNLATALNSSNVANPTITVSWGTSGEWGVGTGNQDATERMLNGMATSSATDAASAQNVTFSGVPPGNHSLLLYTVQVPLEFFNMNFTVVTHDAGGNDVVQRRFIRPQNSDEYNPSPGFILVTSDTAASRSVGNMMRFDNLQPGPDGVILINFYAPGRAQPPNAEPIRGPGLNGLQLLLNPPPVVAPPVITRQPVSANGILGGQITLFVEATGPNITYQWLKNGQAIAGATDSELTLSNLRTNDAGNYSVAISNPAGRIRSRIAVVGVLPSGQITAGLNTYFKFDETDGTVAANSVTGGQNGEVRGLLGFVDWVPGQVGNGITLAANDLDRVFVSNYPKPRDAITVAGWIFSFDAQWGPLINNWVSGQPTGASGQFFLDVTNVIDPVLGSIDVLRGEIEVGPNKVLSSGVVDGTLNVWHHFAMSANGVTLSVYWDGQLVSTTDYLGLLNSAAGIPWLSIGADLSLDPSVDPLRTLANGIVDDLAIWNRSLSDIEIQGIYNGGLAGQNISQVPPVLNINHSPLANDDSATTSQGTPVVINVLANDNDPDNDTLLITSASTPAHGSTFVTTNDTVVYTPSAGYNGPDSFTYRIGDGHGGIGSAAVQVTVTGPANHCPTANPLSVSVSQSGSVNFQLPASDPEGDALQYSITQPPAHGIVVVQVQTGASSYSPTAGYCGPDSFKYKVNDGHCGDSSEATVSITVNCGGNHPPIADAGATATKVISGNNSNAVVHLNGTRSSDPDGDALTYSWFVDGGAVAAAHGPLADIVLEVGDHTIKLMVDDGQASDSDIITVHVLTAGEAVDDLILQVDQADLGRKNKRPLFASLKAATASLDRGSFDAGVGQLRAFQNKIRAQIAPGDPALAQSLIRSAQDILDAIEGQ